MALSDTHTSGPSGNFSGVSSRDHSVSHYRVLIIDNYDSYTFNIYQLIGELTTVAPIVIRNDKLSLRDAMLLEPTHIVLSPGPGNPENELSIGISKEIILELGKSIPLLGICLGHQAIGHAFGAHIVQAPQVVHGKTALVFHDGSGIYNGVPNPFTAMRYHSLVLDSVRMPRDLRVVSHTTDGTIMGIEHRQYPIIGVQFHPESIGTPAGGQLMMNFLAMSTTHQ